MIGLTSILQCWVVAHAVLATAGYEAPVDTEIHFDSPVTPPFDIMANSVCVERLCLYLSPGADIGLRALPGREITYNHAWASKDYISVYLSSLPLAGDLQIRKLWEHTTGLVSERIGRRTSGETDAGLNRRTGAMARTCGGIPLTAKSARESAFKEIWACRNVRLSTGYQPILITTNEPMESPDWRLEPLRDPPTRVDIHVTMIRNPLDQYDELFRGLNAKYLKTRSEHDMAWPVSLEEFLEEFWLPMAEHATAMMTQERPAYVVRHEDLLRNPKQTFEDLLTATGIASTLDLTSFHISSAVAKVESITRRQKGLRKKIGVGFAECQHHSNIYPVNPNFFSKARMIGNPERDDEPVARASFNLLKKHERALARYGYFFWSHTFQGPPPGLESQVALQELAASQRRHALYEGMQRRETTYPPWGSDSETQASLGSLARGFGASLPAGPGGDLRSVWKLLGALLICSTLVLVGCTIRNGASESAAKRIEKKWQQRLSSAIDKANFL